MERKRVKKAKVDVRLRREAVESGEALEVPGRHARYVARLMIYH